MTPTVSETSVTLRPVAPADEPLVFSSWLRSYRTAPAVAQVRGPVYFANQRRVIERILLRAQVLVACSPSEPTDVFGYAVCERTASGLVVHWLYVKHPFRRLGVAGRLLSAAGAGDVATIQHTHETDAGKRLAKRLGSVLNPYLAGAL